MFSAEQLIADCRRASGALTSRRDQGDRQTRDFGSGGSGAGAGYVTAVGNRRIAPIARADNPECHLGAGNVDLSARSPDVGSDRCLRRERGQRLLQAHAGWFGPRKREAAGNRRCRWS